MKNIKINLQKTLLMNHLIRAIQKNQIKKKIKKIKYQIQEI